MIARAQNVRRSQTAIFLLVVAAVWNCSFLHAADAPGYTIRTTTSEVRLAFAAEDHQGHAIKTLRSSDVAVADNGRILRSFHSFLSTQDNPLDLVILLDSSSSMESRLPAEIAGVSSFIQSAKWGTRDRISILTLGGIHPQRLCVRNCNVESALLKLNALRANGATPLYDALYVAAQILGENRDPEFRQAMILFSDGEDTISMRTASDALQAAQNMQVPIYTVSFYCKKTMSSQGEAVLNSLAAGTGGLSFAPEKDAGAALNRILEDLHSGFVLTYELPGSSTGRHTVRVLPTSNPRLQFRSRSAYDDRLDERTNH